jgi:hypothetical protein
MFGMRSHNKLGWGPLCVISLAFCTTGNAMAQSKPRIIIHDPPHPLIRIAPFDGELSTKYAQWALQGSDAERSAVILSNDSDQPILAISSHWTILGPGGLEHRRRERCENVFIGKGPVAEPHSTVLLAPGLCVSE